MTTTAHPELHRPYSLDATARRRFEDQGFVKLPGVLSPGTVRNYEPEITSKVIELNTQRLPLAERDTYGKAFLQVTNLWQHSEVVRDFVFSPRLARVAAELLGVDAVRLYHDQALYKEPGGGMTPWHADQYYWPLSTDRTVTAWIPLQQTPVEMGPLTFAVGSHRFVHGRDLPISDASERELQRALAEQDFPVLETPYELGDVSFHNGWTFHRASPNGAVNPRRVMTVIYMDADITVAEPVNDNQRGDLHAWMPGTAVGEIPATPLNPVLHDREA
ncbi:phytanoyl-CoA dioxygenase family protein [Streptomyces bathyalis]|uniref:Phytanoyl-CoA dioxygenase family protein n=1 Tax=Streptomyces bathyalis TaxID=2710756 RepID=A0A7T1TC16_9ACTN|nr:phytanoyl-CoA dioxygenase family protein [Streptomyces bathyalis]QPP10217.1 phytanoyl-CoA dioxygenase family protein [Streptomyces bathyalis]